MKLKLLPLITLGIYFANSSEFPSKLPKSACKIIRQVLEDENWMKTIAILKLEKNFDEKVTDELIKCLPMDVTVAMIDVFGYDLNSRVIHNPTILVMLVDVFTNENMGILLKMIVDVYKLPLLDYNSKILVLTSKTDTAFHKVLGLNLERYSMVNFAIIFEVNDKVFVDFNNNPGTPLTLNSIDDKIIAIIYPNHLKNIKGRFHNILIAEEIPTTKLVNGELFSKYFYFLEIIEKIQSSHMVYSKLKGPRNVIEKTHDSLILNQQAEMSLILSVTINELITPSLMTYQETKLCPLVPKSTALPEKLSLFKPFELFVWISILISMIICMILWRLSGSSTSMWFIPFFFWAFAQGQSINFATNNKVLIIVLQILVFMLLILGNAYQGVVTSSMIEPDQPETLKSFDELLMSDYKIFVGVYRDSILKDYPKYQAAVEKGKIVVPDLNFLRVNLTEMYENKTAILVACELANHLISTGEASNFYVINENLFPSYHKFTMMFLSKYLKKWQLIMDWCFEAGLHQAWDKFYSDEKIFKEVEENLSGVLKFRDLFAIFYTLIAGNILGFLILICEILKHKYEEH